MIETILMIVETATFIVAVFVGGYLFISVWKAVDRIEKLNHSVFKAQRIGMLMNSGITDRKMLDELSE